MMGTATRERAAREEPRERIQEGAESIEAPADGLFRYARWQLRDFATQKAPVLLLLAVLMLYPMVVGTFDASSSMRRFAQEMREQGLYVMFSMLAPFGTLLATRGIVSEDRHQGFHRFLFAKPIRLARYYAQSFGVGFVGVMGVLAIVAALYVAVIGPVPLLPALIPAAVLFVLFGGVTFLFSTLSRLDWVWTMGAIAVSAWTQYLVDVRKWSWLAPLKAVLLPLDSFGKMVVEWMRVVRPDGDGSVAAAIAASAWPVAYGLIAFGAGLFILKRRSVVR